MKLRARYTGGVGVKLETVGGVQSLSMAARYLDGGRARFLEYVQFAALCEIETAVKFWTVFADLLPGERVVVNFDDVVAAAGVNPGKLMGDIVAVAMQYGADVARLIAASMHPAIVAQAGRSAKRIGGDYADIAHKDRVLMLQAGGTVAAPKGHTVVVNAHASANAQAASLAAADPSVGSFADTMNSLRTVRQSVQQRLIESRPVEAEDDLFDPADIPAAVPTAHANEAE